MAHHKSAIKRNRQQLEARERNRAVRSSMRTAIKKARTEIDGGSASPVAGDVKSAVVALAGAAKKGVLTKRTASRRISRLMKAAAKK